MRLVVVMTLSAALAGCAAQPLELTCGDMLPAHSATYAATPYFAQLQRDAGHDECPAGPDGKPFCGSLAEALLTTGAPSASEPMVAAIGRWQDTAAQKENLVAPEAPILMLSGGGSWGAFGAGFLNRLHRDDWAVVTGISTGSIQGLFVAAGDYGPMEAEYSPDDGAALAHADGYYGIAFRGAKYNMRPLSAKLLQYLEPSDPARSPLVRMSRPGRPELFVGMVEAHSGDLKVVDVTGMVRDGLGGNAHPTSDQLKPVAQCVAAVLLGSSAIPVQLTPVQIDGHTYMDGGVRSSTFEEGIATRMLQAAKVASMKAHTMREPPPPVPHAYVIRNGPTIVFRDKPVTDGSPEYQVDERADAYRVGMRGYSTIVNQNELMSIVALRLNHPDLAISVITADGFNAPENPQPCGKRPEDMFNAPFMKCLVAWGHYKADHGPHWIELTKNP